MAADRDSLQQFNKLVWRQWLGSRPRDSGLPTGSGPGSVEPRMWEVTRDLMRMGGRAGRPDAAWHRVSKHSLRQELVYYGGPAWTGKHEIWLRSHRFTAPGLQIAYDTEFDILFTLNRMPGGISVPPAVALAVEIGDWQ